jgi:hypothetical protein
MQEIQSVIRGKDPGHGLRAKGWKVFKINAILWSYIRTATPQNGSRDVFCAYVILNKRYSVPTTNTSGDTSTEQQTVDAIR